MSAEQFESFEDYYEEAKTDVDEHIDNILEARQEEAEMRKLLAHATEGGKRVRPVITMLVAETVGCPRDRALDHAAIVELIHSASLVADDLHDDDEMRRGMPTTWKIIEKLPFGRSGKKFTQGMTLMTQDGLLALALELTKHPGVTRAMGEGVKQLVNGFYMEAKSSFTGVLSGGYDKYHEVNRLKTGGMFALSAWNPAIVGTDDKEVQESARKYGETMGILYQVADDIVDGDIPPFIEDEEEELEKWYKETVSHVEGFAGQDASGLLYDAPAWVVWRMFEGNREDVPDDVSPTFFNPEYRRDSA